MENIKTKVTEYMDKLKESNPKANWTNLFTGFLIFLLLMAFGFWYFTKEPLNNGSNSKMSQDSNKNSDDKANQTNNYKTEKVLAGEGLYAFSQRVCGSENFASQIAEINLITLEGALNEGQELKYSCEMISGQK